MLATLEQPLSLLTEPASLDATLSYAPEAVPGSQFTWVTSTKNPFLFVSDLDTTITIVLENAVFAEIPVTFISNPENFTIHPGTSNQISLTIHKAPSSYFSPLALSVNVDAEGARGIVSPPLFFVCPPLSASSTIVELAYSISDGNFKLDGATALASLDLLTNLIMPFDVTFKLVTEGLQEGQSVQFNSALPLIGPRWLTHELPSPTVLKASIPSVADKFGSFQFVLDVQTSPGTIVQVTSPDPILINATIGDG